MSWVSSAPSRNGLPPVTAWQACANPALAAGSRCLTSVSVATGPSARGRTGGSGALANSSASSSGAAAGSPTRTAHSTPIAELLQRARQQRQPPQRRRIGPMDIVDDQNCGTALAEVADQPHQPSGGGVHRIARGRGCRLPRARARVPPARPRRPSAHPTPAGFAAARTAAAPSPTRRVARAGCSAPTTPSRRPRAQPGRQPRAASTYQCRPAPQRRSRAPTRNERWQFAWPAPPTRHRDPTTPPSPQTVPPAGCQRQGSEKRSWRPPRCTQRRRHRSSRPDDRPERTTMSTTRGSSAQPMPTRSRARRRNTSVYALSRGRGKPPPAGCSTRLPSRPARAAWTPAVGPGRRCA